MTPRSEWGKLRKISRDDRSESYAGKDGELMVGSEVNHMLRLAQIAFS